MLTPILGNEKMTNSTVGNKIRKMSQLVMCREMKNDFFFDINFVCEHK